MVLLELFWSFCKIGFTSFGGLSMVPLINHEMLSHGWMSLSEVSDIVAIAEMTPGPLGLNCATFAGTRVAGFLGALSASLGVLSPTFLLCAAAAVAFEKFRDSSFMQKAMSGIRPICLGLILAVVCSLSMTNYAAPAGGVSLPALVIGTAALAALLKWKVSIPIVIAASALLGLVLIR
ncbi:chromate transporter [Oscillibacter valericigenes]|uniref:chromate transporter n=1 Tax=Oscillibacter valericigenes TaxID=351091 RepID=UPI001F1BABE9|nr:chromate transporter [Oscillibacter valericigenes]MCF2664592.1 chromate transporter [Oscillibacter valericigenes]